MSAKQAHKARMQQLKDQARKVVEGGKCPDCGCALVRNNGLAGWYQCGAYACEAFRGAAFKGLPKCHFQCFTE